MWLHLSIRRGEIKLNKTFCAVVCVRLSAQTVKRQLNELEEWKRSVKKRIGSANTSQGCVQRKYNRHDVIRTEYG